MAIRKFTYLSAKVMVKAWKVIKKQISEMDWLNEVWKKGLSEYQEGHLHELKGKLYRGRGKANHPVLSLLEELKKQTKNKMKKEESGDSSSFKSETDLRHSSRVRANHKTVWTLNGRKGWLGVEKKRFLVSGLKSLTVSAL